MSSIPDLPAAGPGLEGRGVPSGPRGRGRARLVQQPYEHRAPYPCLCLGQRAERTRRPLDPAQEPQRRVPIIGPEPGPGPPAEIGGVSLRRRDPASVAVPRPAPRSARVLAYEARRGPARASGGAGRARRRRRRHR